MSMKKTDLEKNMAKKLSGRLKSEAIPQRFGAGSSAPTVKKDKPAAVKTVSLTVRVPAELAMRLQEHAARRDGGASVVVTQAIEHWLAQADSSPVDPG